MVNGEFAPLSKHACATPTCWDVSLVMRYLKVDGRQFNNFVLRANLSQSFYLINAFFVWF